MSLAFLSVLLQCFISLLCCRKQKSVLLLPGATGDPQPIAKKGTRWASPPLDFTESFEPCTKVSNALYVSLYQGLLICAACCPALTPARTGDLRAPSLALPP